MTIFSSYMNTHTHTHIYIYIHISYMTYVCMYTLRVGEASLPGSMSGEVSPPARRLRLIAVASASRCRGSLVTHGDPWCPW